MQQEQCEMNKRQMLCKAKSKEIINSYRNCNIQVWLHKLNSTLQEKKQDRSTKKPKRPTKHDTHLHSTILRGSQRDATHGGVQPLENKEKKQRKMMMLTRL
jgi:hypothetical protein